ncbi:MAG: TIGR03668 family PPOX class F420-dependent oxidoreductase [Acidimicrobiales bacterium]
MDARRARRRLTSARVGYLATVTVDNRAHVVPCCFALDDETVYSAVDDVKAKSTPALRRFQNIRANGAVSLLVDHYDEDWATLWWVRVDGEGRVVDDGVERDRAVDLLAAKYEQYRSARPPGPVLAIAIDRWRMWP